MQRGDCKMSGGVYVDGYCAGSAKAEIIIKYAGRSPSCSAPRTRNIADTNYTRQISVDD